MMDACLDWQAAPLSPSAWPASDAWPRMRGRACAGDGPMTQNVALKQQVLPKQRKFAFLPRFLC
jgi:hypothetical protein